MTLYMIQRFYADPDTPTRTIFDGLTLEEAQVWCKREDTHGDDWFDGYTESEYMEVDNG